MSESTIGADFKTLSDIAKAVSKLGGVPFSFNARSQKGRFFLYELEVVLDFKLTRKKILQQLPKLFGKHWGARVIRFDDFATGRFEVGLSPDDFALNLAAELSENNNRSEKRKSPLSILNEGDFCGDDYAEDVFR